jgi:hypothetical protein
MEKPMAVVDKLGQRLERLERENRRWKCVAGVAALSLTLSLTLGGLLGSRAVVAQQHEKARNPEPRRTEYKVTDAIYVHLMEKPLRDLAAEGWELVQVVPTDSFAVGKGVMFLRRPMVPGK